MTSRALLAVISATAFTVVGLSTPVSAAAAPRVVVAPSSVQPGQSVIVQGDGFPPTVDLETQICGNDALDGSADCALSSSQEIATTSFGQFEVSMVVALPPVPCPCVVMVTSAALDITPTGPITIVGARTAPLRRGATAAVTEPLKVSAVSLSGWGPWTALFGAEPHRTLTLRVLNPNNAPYSDPPLVLRVGRPGSPGSVVDTKDIGTIGPHQARTLQVPVTLSPFTFGTQQVTGRVGFVGYSAPFSDGTAIIPWGLVAVALMLAQLLLLAVRNRVRRRIATQPQTPSADSALEVLPPPPALPDQAPPAPAAVSVRALAVAPGSLAALDAEGPCAVLAAPLESRLARDPSDGTQMLALLDVGGECGSLTSGAVGDIIGLLQARMRADDVIVQVGPRTIGALCSARPRMGGDGASRFDPASRLAERLALLADEAMGAASVPGWSRAAAVSADSGTGVGAGEMVRQAMAGLAG